MGKNKNELLAEARELGIEVPDGATNRQINNLLKPARVLAREAAKAAPSDAAESTAEAGARHLRASARLGPTRRGTPRLSEKYRRRD